MIAELGQILLILALLTAVFQSAFPLAGSVANDRRLAAVAGRAAVLQFVLIVGAFGALLYVFAISDFSVRTVAENSHSAKPFIYKLTGAWGNHEGSMLLWALILAGYGAVLGAGKSARGGETLTARTLSVQGGISVAFLAFVLFTSNPFDRLTPAPEDGQGLNPLLQDPGLVLHPPFLYLGYVGFSITFAFAVAGLLSGRIDEAWGRAVRPWALAAWSFLTVGIALGSWWAYYELGWGGFWAWDPVENASFMPWLAGTALIHSVRALEVRGAFKAWTALLAILAFSLSLVGTFLVRSGVLTSVHAFAVDPARGVFILGILALAVGGSLTVFALRGPALAGSARFDAVSREGGLLVNNAVLVASCATVFIGTFYPLFIDVLSGEKLSVGAPYFNLAFLPFAGLTLFLIGPAATLAWKRGSLRDAFVRLWPAALAAGGGMVVLLSAGAPRELAALGAAALAFWAGASIITDFARRVRIAGPGALARTRALPAAYVAMALAHFGLAVAALGVVGAGAWRAETIVYARVGEVVSVGGFDARLLSVEEAPGPNFISTRAMFDISRGGKAVRRMFAEKRFYPVRGMQTTEAGIWTTLAGDLYLTIGEEDAARGWVVRAWRYPLTSWMWIGAGVMTLGGLVAAFGGRAPVRVRKTVKPSSAPMENAPA